MSSRNTHHRSSRDNRPRSPRRSAVSRTSESNPDTLLADFNASCYKLFDTICHAIVKINALEKSSNKPESESEFSDISDHYDEERLKRTIAIVEKALNDLRECSNKYGPLFDGGEIVEALMRGNAQDPPLSREESLEDVQSVRGDWEMVEKKLDKCLSDLKKGKFPRYEHALESFLAHHQHFLYLQTKLLDRPLTESELRSLDRMEDELREEGFDTHYEATKARVRRVNQDVNQLRVEKLKAERKDCG
ncbi:hypothetical protein CC80DRAFT_542773 [Byssothecium circinans]|uniref:Uncharacterized protein n=1 Tax=Byssothecium circinans TaxID=147558 RepID=A0A6A5UBC2_9PLEO|nr:hypothetical protein CC80DRAFT_542773 [Byssothecium circinans]